MRFKVAFLSVAAFCFASISQGALILSITSPDNLSNLQVGNSVSFQVSVSGIAANDQVDFLTGDVLVPSSIFSIPTGLTAGAIVPTTSGFNSISSIIAGTPDHRLTGGYDGSAVSSMPITSNGLFFTFNATVIGSGSGQIGFDSLLPPAVAGLNTVSMAPIFDIGAGPALAFNVSAVPEPSSLLLTLMSTTGFACYRNRGRTRNVN